MQNQQLDFLLPKNNIILSYGMQHQLYLLVEKIGDNFIFKSLRLLNYIPRNNTQNHK